VVARVGVARGRVRVGRAWSVPRLSRTVKYFLPPTRAAPSLLRPPAGVPLSCLFPESSRTRPSPELEALVPVLPGAEPYRREGGDTGVLLCHGFTGSPRSMRPWAEYLADRGLTVSLPLLPGHGTRWQELQSTGWQDWYAEVDLALRELLDTCARVFVCGLSMGGALALRLAQKHGSEITGVVVVNPAVKVHGLAAHALPLLRHVVPTTKGLANDVAKEGADETGYTRVPLHAAHSLRTFFRRVDAGLPQVTQPLLLLRSREDHVVPAADSARVLSRVSSVDVREILLEQSYHVATLDHDAERVFQESHAFIGRLAPGAGVAPDEGQAAQEGSSTGG
jgi:carboxylesterase